MQIKNEKEVIINKIFVKYWGTSVAHAMNIFFSKTMLVRKNTYLLTESRLFYECKAL